MRQALRAIVLVAVVFAISESARAGSHLYPLYVQGLACPMCAYALELRLKKLIGVIGVQADYRESVVTITMLAGFPLNEQAAMRTVGGAGFTPIHLERLTEGGLGTPAQGSYSN